MRTFKVTYDKQQCLTDYNNYSKFLAKETKKFLIVFSVLLAVGLIFWFFSDSDAKIIAESVVVGSSVSTVLFTGLYIFQVNSPKRKIKKFIEESSDDSEIIIVDQDFINSSFLSFNLRANWTEFKFAYLIDGTLFISRTKKEFPLRFNPNETGQELFDLVYAKVETIVEN